MSGWRIPSLVLAGCIIAAILFSMAGCSGESESVVEEKSSQDMPEVVDTLRQGADQTVRDSNIRAIDAAIGRYYASNGYYPGSMDELVPGFLASVPVDPLGGSYYITSDGSGMAKAAVR